MAKKLPAYDEEVGEQQAPGSQQPRRGFKFFDRLRKKQDAQNGKADGDDMKPVVPSAHAFLNAAVDVNDETIDAIKRSERLAQEAEDMGRETSQKVARNREQIEVVDRTMDDFEPMTKRAKKEMMVMVRKMFRDKCFMTMLCLVVCLLVGIAVVMITRDDESTENDNTNNNTTIVVGAPVPTNFSGP